MHYGRFNAESMGSTCYDQINSTKTSNDPSGSKSLTSRHRKRRSTAHGDKPYIGDLSRAIFPLQD